MSCDGETGLEDRIFFEVLKSNGGLTPLTLVKRFEGKYKKSVINKILYGLKEKGLLVKTDTSPPQWKVNLQNETSTQTVKKEPACFTKASFDEKNQSSLACAPAESSLKENPETEDYYMHKKDGYISQGRYGGVFKVVAGKNPLSKIWALKVYKLDIDDDDESGEEKRKYEKELELLEKAGETTEYVVKIVKQIEVQRRRAILMEYCERGTLESLQKFENPCPFLLYKVYKQLADAIKYLHISTTDHKRITHNDLKPSNVLLTKNFDVRLCDFGGSLEATSTAGRDQQHSRSMLGVAHSYFFLAPERSQNLERVPEKASDVYSFGVCLYTSLVRDAKLEGVFCERFRTHARKMTAPLRRMLLGLEEKAEDEDAADILFELIEIMRLCCVDDPKRRPTMEEVEKKMDRRFTQHVIKRSEETVERFNRKHPLSPYSYKSGSNEWVSIEKVNFARYM